MQFLGLKAYGTTVRFDASDATKYMMLRSTEDIIAVPVDNTEYLVGEHLGNAKVFYNENKKSLYQFRESVANTIYHFAVFAYNQSGGNINYKSDNPLKGSQATLGKFFDGYYADYRIDTENAIEDLSVLLRNHNDLLYGDYDDAIIDNLLAKDTTIIVGGSLESRKYVVCEYSNIIDIYEKNLQNYDFNVFNREHVTPRSWMPSTPGSNDDHNETTDYFNLFLVKASVNQTLRSNNVFDEVVSANSTELDCKKGDNVDGVLSFEPKESIKGDVARTLFYQTITYNGISGSWAFNNLQSNGDIQNVDLLLQWHAQDPVDNFEIARNELIYNEQGNRNPFIDNPEWVDCIDFKTMTLNGSCPLDTAQDVIDSTISIIDFNESKNLIVYPNPVTSSAYVKLLDNEEIISLDLLNMNGSKVSFKSEIDRNISTFNVEGLSKGMYIMQINTKDKVSYKKIQVARK